MNKCEHCKTDIISGTRCYPCENELNIDELEEHKVKQGIASIDEPGSVDGDDLRLIDEELFKLYRIHFESTRSTTKSE